MIIEMTGSEAVVMSIWFMVAIFVMFVSYRQVMAACEEVDKLEVV